MTYLPLFRDLETLFYVKFTHGGAFVESNEVLNRHLGNTGFNIHDINLLFTARALRLVRAASSRALRTDWGVQVSVSVRGLNGTPMPIRMHIVNIDGELIFLGWEINPDDRAKILRELAWLMSHVIRKPAANLLGLLPLIERTAENAQVLDFANDAVRELDAGIRMVSDLIVKSERNSE